VGDEVEMTVVKANNTTETHTYPTLIGDGSAYAAIAGVDPTAKAIKIKLLDNQVAELANEDFSRITELDLNGKVLKFTTGATAEAPMQLAVSSDLVIKNSGTKGFVEFGANITIVKEGGENPVPAELTFDSVIVNIAGTLNGVVNILGDVSYYGNVGNATFKSQTRSSVTFCQDKYKYNDDYGIPAAAKATFVDATDLAFVGNMLTVSGTIDGVFAVNLSTNDGENATTPAFRLQLPGATITVVDRVDVTGSMEAKKIILNAKVLYVHQASSLKVEDFEKNQVVNNAVVIDDGRFGVDVGATFTVTNKLTPEYQQAVLADNEIIGYKYADFTYNSYVLGSFILSVDVADHTAVPNPDPVPELQSIPMFSFEYSYVKGTVLETKMLSMLLPANNKFPNIYVFNDNTTIDAGNYIKDYSEVLIGWTDVKDSKTVKYAVGDALPEDLATVYYPIYESDVWASPSPVPLPSRAKSPMHSICTGRRSSPLTSTPASSTLRRSVRTDPS
jgi:hypothetical protein